MKLNNRLLIALALVVISFILLEAPSQAEILPTKGRFRGIYQVTRSGVGRLEFFVFSKDLKEKMAPFENKYVEIEVLKASQAMNPGKVYIDQIGVVTRLPDPPLELRLKAVSSSAGDDSSFELVCMVVNRSAEEVIFDAETLQMGVRGYPQVSPERSYVDFSNSGYTGRQLSFGGDLTQVSNFLTPMKPGARTHFYSRQIALRPTEEAPFVIHGMRREPGEHEMAATASYWTKGQRIPIAAAVPIDLPLAHEHPNSRQPLKVECRFVHDDEWLEAEGVISDPAEMGVSVFAKAAKGLHFLPGLVQLNTTSDEPLEADLDWNEPDGAWQKSVLDRKGLHFKFRVRNRDRFSRMNIARVGLWTVTSRGLERLLLSDQVAPRMRPAPLPWGTTTHGCRMRIETARTAFAAGEKIRFFVQAESDGGEADMLWVNDGKFWFQVLATVDGKNARIETTGISDGHVYHFPFQADVGLAKIDDLAPGKHVLRFSVQGDAGIYKNLRGESFRKLDATLESNVVEFEVR